MMCQKKQYTTTEKIELIDLEDKIANLKEKLKQYDNIPLSIIKLITELSTKKAMIESNKSDNSYWKKKLDQIEEIIDKISKKLK